METVKLNDAKQNIEINLSYLIIFILSYLFIIRTLNGINNKPLKNMRCQKQVRP